MLLFPVLGTLMVLDGFYNLILFVFKLCVFLETSKI